MIDPEKVRQEVAMQHNMLMDKDDPALATLALFDAVLEQSVSTLNTQQAVNVKALIAAVQQGITEGKKAAGKIVTEGADLVSDQVHAAVTSAMDEGREELRKDIRLAWNKIEEARKAAAMWAAVSSLCAAITVGAVLANVF